MTTVDGPTLVWRAHWLPALARTVPGRLVFAIAILIPTVAATVILATPWLGAVLLAALVVALDQLLLPIRYRLDEQGVEIRTLVRTRRHSWAELTTANRTRHGVHLGSPIRRTLHLLVEQDERARVLEFALERMPSRHSST